MSWRIGRTRCGAVRVSRTSRSRALSMRDADRALGEVAQAAVDELGAPAARAPGEVAALDERDAQPARGGVERGAGAGRRRRRRRAGRAGGRRAAPRGRARAAAGGEGVADVTSGQQCNIVSRMRDELADLRPRRALGARPPTTPLLTDDAARAAGRGLRRVDGSGAGAGRRLPRRAERRWPRGPRGAGGRRSAPAQRRLDDAARAAHANGMSYLDLMRRGADAAAGARRDRRCPPTRRRSRGVLAACAEHGVAVVPFGGGTSVVGGVAPLARRASPRSSRWTSRGWTGSSPSTRSRGPRPCRPGVTGPRAEELLAAHGLTLGHVPQSFERATIGGYAATRSAGQLSTGLGALRRARRAPARRDARAAMLDLGRAPGTAAGPDLRQLLLGSEGALRRHHRGDRAGAADPRGAPPRGLAGRRLGRRARGAARRWPRTGRRPDLARLSDEVETAHGRRDRRRASADGRLPAARRLGGRGRGRRARAAGAAARAGGRGREAAWRRGRGGVAARALPRAAPARRAAPAAACWPRRWRPRVAGATWPSSTPRSATRCATRWTARCRSSPATSRTSTRPARRCTSPCWRAATRDDPVGQWRRAKRAACDGDRADRGDDHPPPRGRRRPRAVDGRRGRRDSASTCCAAVKARLDPAGILNPGKLLPG